MIKLEDCLFLDRIFLGVKMGQSQGTAVIHSSRRNHVKDRQMKYSAVQVRANPPDRATFVDI